MLMHFHSTRLNVFDSVVSMFVLQQKIEFHYFRLAVVPMCAPENQKNKIQISINKKSFIFNNTETNIPATHCLVSQIFEFRIKIRKSKRVLEMSNDKNHWDML